MDINIKRDGLTLRGKTGAADTETNVRQPSFFMALPEIWAMKGTDFSRHYADLLTEKELLWYDLILMGMVRAMAVLRIMNVLNEIEDAIAILEYVRKLDFVTEIYVIGHSQGRCGCRHAGRLLSGC